MTGTQDSGGRNEDPFPAVLDELVNMSSVGSVNIGLVEVPIERIIGTYTGGRKAAFAGNFMPLMETKTEFGDKWINLCVAHLDQGGITDPIICYEYLGNFYVREGHKRVSVLRSFTKRSGTCTNVPYTRGCGIPLSGYVASEIT